MALRSAEPGDWRVPGSAKVDTGQKFPYGESTTGASVQYGTASQPQCGQSWPASVCSLPQKIPQVLRAGRAKRLLMMRAIEGAAVQHR